MPRSGTTLIEQILASHPRVYGAGELKEVAALVRDGVAQATEAGIPPERVVLAHGGGGSLMHSLIESVFRPALANPLLDQRHDGAVFEVAPG